MMRDKPSHRRRQVSRFRYVPHVFVILGGASMLRQGWWFSETPSPDLHDSSPLAAEAYSTTTVVRPLESPEIFTLPVLPHRRVELLEAAHFGEVSRDIFSGAVWAPIQSFLDVPISSVKSPLDATWKVMGHGYKKVRLTKDWMDLSCEHMSKWWKILLAKGDKSVYAKVVDFFQNYIDTRDSYSDDVSPHLAPYFTLAVIPIMLRKNNMENTVNKYALAATLSSLWQIGIPRAVIVGQQQDDGQIQQVFQMVRKRTKKSTRTIDLEYVWGYNSTTETYPVNLPKASLLALQLAFEGSSRMKSDEQNRWLGPNRNRWKYIYFTEEDIILHTRPSSLQTLTRALEQGYILAPHRFQPIPHESDFVGMLSMKGMVPAVSIFEQVSELDSYWAGDSCCDEGPVKPGLEPVMEKCHGKFWWQCGFGEQDEEYKHIKGVVRQHKRLVPYPLIRMKHGLGVTMIAGAESGRRCFPTFGQGCSERKFVSQAAK